MSAPQKIAPPTEYYWAHCAGDKVWAVRAPGVDWPEEPEYIGFSVDDLLLWMVVKEIDRMQVRRVRNGVMVVFWLVRARHTGASPHD